MFKQKGLKRIPLVILLFTSGCLITVVITWFVSSDSMTNSIYQSGAYSFMVSMPSETDYLSEINMDDVQVNLYTDSENHMADTDIQVIETSQANGSRFTEVTANPYLNVD